MAKTKNLFFELDEKLYYLLLWAITENVCPIH